MSLSISEGLFRQISNQHTLPLFVLERLAAHLWTHVRYLMFISTYILQPMLSSLMYMHHVLLLIDNAPFLPVLL